MAESVRVNTHGIDHLMRIVESDVSPGNPQRIMLRRWAARYATFTRKRFIQQSRGGGNWPPLAASTKRKRRKPSGRGAKKKGNRKFAILVDTGQLRDAIEPRAFGNLLTDGKGYVDIGFAPQARKSDRVTMGRLAQWHHYGMGNNPERPILVQPDESTLRGMRSDARDAGSDIERIIGRGP